MSDEDSEEADYWNASERHSQTMAEGSRFFRRLGWGIVGVVVVVCGFIIFLIWR